MEIDTWAVVEAAASAAHETLLLVMTPLGNLSGIGEKGGEEIINICIVLILTCFMWNVSPLRLCETKESLSGHGSVVFAYI